MAEVVLALDVPSPGDAADLLDQLPEGAWVKVGSVLMAQSGAPFLDSLVERRFKVFLDLKWHDIPNTVAGAVRAAASMGVSMATVHTLGGSAMMTAALQSAGAEMALVGVTVLTSHTSESYGRTVGRGAVVVEHEVSRLATLAQEAGLAGVVCSPNEIHTVRATMPPDGLIVTPGIRRADDAVGDQARAATPRAAAQAGATHIVVGRPVLQASDPGAAFREIAEEARCEH